MKKVFLILLQILLAVSIYSQHYVSKKWDARFGGISFDGLSTIAQTNDGGYLLGGESSSGIGDNKTQSCRGGADYWIVKINANGVYQWDKTYGGTDADYLSSLRVTSDGGYILAGNSVSDSGADKTQPSWGGWDYWVVKVDSLGNKQWDKDFGGVEDEFLYDIKTTSDGGYILAGRSNSGISGDKTQDNRDPSLFTADYWIIKIDSAGSKQWDKRFGSIQDDAANDIIQTRDGGYLLGGTTAAYDTSGDKTQKSFGSSANNFWVVKTDSMGNKLWDKVYGGTNGELFGNALNIHNGGYILGGTSYDGISGNKTTDIAGYWIVKIDTDGNKLADWAYGTTVVQSGGFAEEQILNSMTQTNDGGYILTGTSGSVIGNDKTENNLGSVQVWTIKIDSLMNRVWDKTTLTTGSNDQSAGALESANGCYVISVQTTAGIGGDKTQPNWDTTGQTLDYWVVEYCDSFPTGIPEPEGSIHLLVYPNPTSSDLYINIQKDNLTGASFALTNTSGQYIYQSTADHLAHSYTKILDLSQLPTGVYMVEVVVDGERIVKKVVKE